MCSSDLGSPNFTHIPVNSPRGCPVHNFQQDGHMAMRNPKGRVNYEPNSWGGPREDPERGYRHFAAEEAGQKVQLRPESFADHYSQARQFFISQTAIEQKHIGDALVFELSKCGRVDIRERMVGHLRNIDEKLARTVAAGLGLPDMPPAAQAAVAPRTDLPPSDALSIVRRGPGSFAGRKLGILVTDGASGELLAALTDAIDALPATWELVTPRVGGATLDDGTLAVGKQKIDGGASVLYDAVVLLLSAPGAALLARDAVARDFAADAFAHCKFIGFTADAVPLLEKAGIAEKDRDEGLVPLGGAGDVAAFIEKAGQLRFWERELHVDLDAASFLEQR